MCNFMISVFKTIYGEKKESVLQNTFRVHTLYVFQWCIIDRLTNREMRTRHKREKYLKT